jgi:hypothetical protein
VKYLLRVVTGKAAVVGGSRKTAVKDRVAAGWTLTLALSFIAGVASAIALRILSRRAATA